MNKIRILVAALVMIVLVPQIFAQEKEKKAIEDLMRQKKLEAYQREMAEMELKQDHMKKQLMEERAAELFGKFSEEQEKEGLEFLKENVPAYYDEVVEMKSANPNGYKKMVVEAVQRKWSIQSRAGGDQDYMSELVDIYSMDMETRRLVMKYRSADAGERESIRSSLRQTLAQLFDLREREREREMVSLEERLAALQENLKLRKQNKSLIVDNRIKQLLGEASNLEW